jgi:hypothetical protein
MVMSYVAGATVEQCSQANIHFGRADCCQSPTPKACINGGHADYDYWGVDHDAQGSSLSYAEIKAQIDSNRPVGFRWAWTGGGAHLMVIIGYSTMNGTPMLLVNNPWPPNKGKQVWISYDDYLASPSHTQSGNDFNFKDHPHCYADFSEVSNGDFQRCFDEWTTRGRIPETLAADGNVLAGSFVKGDSVPVNDLIAPSFFQLQFDALSLAGWRPRSISVTSSGDVRFSVIWTKKEAPFDTRFGLTEAELQSRHSDLSAQGYGMVDLYGYDDSNGRRFTATWVQGAAPTHFEVDLTEGGYSAELPSKTNAGQRPHRFSQYQLNGSTHVAVLWGAETNAFYHYYNMSADSYQWHYSSMANAGYRVKNISLYQGNYSAVWVKQ